MSDCGDPVGDEVIEVCSCGRHLLIEVADDPDRAEMIAALAAMISLGQEDRDEARMYAIVATELRQHADDLRESQT